MRITTIAFALAVSLFSSIATPCTSSAANDQHSQPSLHRVDFRIEGASCVACLRRIAKTMKETKGVLKADVSIYRPYWAIAIYDAKTAKWDKIQADISKSEKVRFMELEDKPIAEMPLVVIPRVGSAGAKVQK
jgi:copper chaperone CopZ